MRKLPAFTDDVRAVALETLRVLTVLRDAGVGICATHVDECCMARPAGVLAALAYLDDVRAASCLAASKAYTYPRGATETLQAIENAAHEAGEGSDEAEAATELSAAMGGILPCPLRLTNALRAARVLLFPFPVPAVVSDLPRVAERVALSRAYNAGDETAGHALADWAEEHGHDIAAKVMRRVLAGTLPARPAEGICSGYTCDGIHWHASPNDALAYAVTGDADYLADETTPEEFRELAEWQAAGHAPYVNTRTGASYYGVACC